MRFAKRALNYHPRFPQVEYITTSSESWSLCCFHLSILEVLMERCIKLINASPFFFSLMNDKRLSRKDTQADESPLTSL